jgi:hypothetical protein
METFSLIYVPNRHQVKEICLKNCFGVRQLNLFNQGKVRQYQVFDNRKRNVDGESQQSERKYNH